MALARLGLSIPLPKSRSWMTPQHRLLVPRLLEGPERHLQPARQLQQMMLAVARRAAWQACLVG